MTETTGARAIRFGAWTQWAILLLVTAFLAVAAGGRFLVGLVFDEMQQHFRLTHGELGSVVSVSVLMVGLGQPLVGWLVDRFSARVVASGGLLLLGTGLVVISQSESRLGLVIGYGVLAGLGLATLTPTVMTPVVAAWFERRRTTALSIVSTANPMGQSLVVPVLALLIAVAGWQEGYFLLGLLVAAVGAPAIFLLLKERRDGRARPEQDSGGCEVGQALTSAAWWQLAVGFFVCGFTMAWVMTYFVDYALQHGLGRGEAALGLSLTGWMSLVGAIATGWWLDRVGTSLPLAVVYALRGIGFGLLLLAGSWEPAVLFAVAVIGFSWSATTPLTSSLCVALYGRRNLGTIFGLLFAVMPIGSAAGAAVSGLLYDLTGGYEASLLVGLGAGLLAAAVVWPIRVTPHFRSGRLQASSPVPTALGD